MVIKRSKKITKQRGSQRYGHGRIHRKSGARGGKGHAGIGKRGKSMKPSASASGRRLGKAGFKRHSNSKKDKTINIKDLEQKLTKWLESNKIKKEGDVYVVELGVFGYTKLLSTGKATQKIKLTVEKATEKAVEKIKSVGGDAQVKTAKK